MTIYVPLSLIQNAECTTRRREVEPTLNELKRKCGSLGAIGSQMTPVGEYKICVTLASYCSALDDCQKGVFPASATSHEVIPS
jgi:hypothetical protein